MFERIVVATDLSPASYAVVRCLGGLRVLGTRECLLLQCLTMGDAASAALSYDAGPLEAMLEEQRAILAEQGYAVETRVVVGSPRRQIVSIAAAEHFGLIVVGSQGRSLVAERLLGGVAYSVIDSASTPVLMLPVERREDEETTCEVARCAFAEHVLHATDFSTMADAAFGYVRDLVAQGVRKVTLLHVQDEVKLAHHAPERLEEFDAIDRERLEALRQTLLEAGRAEVELEVCHGVPQREITRVTRERDVQLAVLGTQGRGFMGEVMLGSVSHAVARRSAAPVLLARS
jgi:nucleotide-binding universal stress UspA family protein